MTVLLGGSNSRSFLQGLDRCVNHFVTRPTFRLPRVLHDRPPSHVFHFRTGYADVGDADLPAASTASASEACRWFRSTGCDASLLRRLGSDALSISDSLGWSKWLSASFGTRFVDHTARSTRSWNTDFESKRAAATDLYAIGLASVLYVGERSSYPGPALARSVCVRQVVNLADACPGVEQTFIRDLSVFTSDRKALACGRHRCSTMFHLLVAKHLRPGHPCFNVSRPACRASYLRALATGHPAGRSEQLPACKVVPAS